MKLPRYWIHYSDFPMKSIANKITIYVVVMEGLLLVVQNVSNWFNKCEAELSLSFEEHTVCFEQNMSKIKSLWEQINMDEQK